MLSSKCSRCGADVNADELSNYNGKEYCKRCMQESAYNATDTGLVKRKRLPKRRSDDLER